MASISATILSGQSLSGVVSFAGYRLICFYMPTAWTAANLTFQSSDSENGTYLNVFDDSGNEVTIQAAADRCITIDANLLKITALDFVKLRSGPSATPINQLADRLIGIHMKS